MTKEQTMNLIEATDLRKTYRLSRQSTIDTDHFSLGGAGEVPLAVSPSRRRLARRHLWLVPGLAIAFYANAQAGEHGLGLGVLLLFGIVPHLPALLSVRQPHARGQMAPRAVPLFNAMHHPAPPLVLLALAAAGILSPFWFVGALAWFSHIVVDLAFGHGLRKADGWRRRWWTWR
jgi:hypothetical protein